MSHARYRSGNHILGADRGGGSDCYVRAQPPGNGERLPPLFIYSLIPPSHQLLHLHVQRRCQGDEGAQAWVHRGAGAGLALLELLVGVGGDAGGVGQGFLAEALGDAGALQPQTRLAGDGPPLLVLAGGGGSAHDHQRQAGANLAPPYMYGNLGMSAEREVSSMGGC